MPIVLPSTARPALAEPTYVRPPTWKPVLAWAGVAAGGLMLVGAAGSLGTGLRAAGAALLLGLALALTGAWWLYCERRDAAHADDDHRLDTEAALAGRAMAGYVAPDALAPLTWHTPLVPVRRRWPLVGTSAFALFAAAMALMPPAAPAPVPAASTDPVTRTVTTTASATPAPTTAAAVAPAPRATQVGDPATRPVTTGTVEAVDPTTRAVVEQTPPEPTYAPAAEQTYAPVAEPAYTPAPRPVGQAVSYANCTAARAAGVAPIRVGEPGYSTKLDRDGDGIACE